MEVVRPLIKTTSQDVEAYQIRRDRFLDAQILFKTGFAESGILALNYLQQMFYILPAGRYIKENKEKAQAFVDRIDDMRIEIMQYIKRKEAKADKNYLEFNDYKLLDNKFDAVVLEFYTILFEVGFTP